MILTKKGKELFSKIEPLIKGILKTESEFLKIRDINFGTYSTMNSKILSKCINQFYEDNKETNINIVNNKIEELISMLDKSEIDIILSKKINEDLYNKNNIKYVKLGNLEEVLITNINSKIKDKTIDINDLKNEIIYIPRNDSPAILNFVKELQNKGINNIKRIDSATMIKILESGNGVGLITKEYITEEIEQNKIVVLKHTFNIETSEIGIYVRKNERFKQLNIFIEILKERFNRV